jgi:hypothetical protein
MSLSKKNQIEHNSAFRKQYLVAGQHEQSVKG